jgi:carboxyl-terminal processing protease
VATAKNGAADDDGLQADERSLTTDVAAEKARKAEKDVVLQEAAHIVADIVELIRGDTKLAARVLPHAAIEKPVD